MLKSISAQWSEVSALIAASLAQHTSNMCCCCFHAGPLAAVVRAQAAAAKSTINFIKTVGFYPPAPETDPFFQDDVAFLDEQPNAVAGSTRAGKAINVNFSYVLSCMPAGAVTAVHFHNLPICAVIVIAFAFCCIRIQHHQFLGFFILHCTVTTACAKRPSL